MKKNVCIKDICITLGILVGCFFLCLFIQYAFRNNSLLPAIFILGAFLTSLVTEGYVYGIVSALISVLAVNFAFTFPYFAFDFTVMENIISGGILLAVSVITCSLTTKIKQQEAVKIESEKEKMRANLLRAVSHDLRTPLTTIYSTSSVLLENFDNFDEEEHKKMLSGIMEDARWLTRMVENLLSITKLDGVHIKIQKAETVLDELVDSILVKFAKRYPDREVEVDIPEEFVTVPMDAILIEQVVLNLLENAVQHAKGATEIGLSVFVQNGQAVFEIWDNGAGIPEEKRKDIFSGKFTTYPNPGDGQKNNAGIGLSVCASIIKAHGGEIGVENREEGGVLFRFMLSMEDAENE